MIHINTIITIAKKVNVFIFTSAFGYLDILRYSDTSYF